MFLSAPSLEEYKKEVKARFDQRDGAKTATQRLSKWFGKKSVQLKETGVLSGGGGAAGSKAVDSSRCVYKLVVLRCVIMLWWCV